MTDIFRRFYTTKGRKEVVAIDGVYFYREICDGHVTEAERYDNFESAERRYNNAIKGERRGGFRTKINDDFTIAYVAYGTRSAERRG